MPNRFAHVLNLDEDPAVCRILRGFFVAAPPPRPSAVARLDDARRARLAR